MAQCNDPWGCLAVDCSEIRRHEGELVGKECIILCVDVCLRAEDNEVGDTAVEGIVSIVASVGVERDRVEAHFVLGEWRKGGGKR